MPDVLHNPGVSPFERIVRAAEYDYEVCGALVYEQALVLSGGLSGSSGRMTPGELRHAALSLATTALAVYAMLDGGMPIASVLAHAKSVATILEGKEAAA